MEIFAADGTHLFYRLLVVNSVDNANHICLWDRQTDTDSPLGVYLNSALHCEVNREAEWLTLEISWNNCSSVCSASAGQRQKKRHPALQSQTKRRSRALTHLSSPRCVWGLSLAWRLQVWWFPQLGKEPGDEHKSRAAVKPTSNSKQPWRSCDRKMMLPYHVWELLADQGHDERRLPHLGCGWRAQTDSSALTVIFQLYYYILLYVRPCPWLSTPEPETFWSLKSLRLCLELNILELVFKSLNSSFSLRYASLRSVFTDLLFKVSRHSLQSLMVFIALLSNWF